MSIDKLEGKDLDTAIAKARGWRASHVAKDLWMWMYDTPQLGECWTGYWNKTPLYGFSGTIRGIGSSGEYWEMASVSGEEWNPSTNVSAVWGLEEDLSGNERCRYIDFLCDAVNMQWAGYGELWSLVHASPTERCRAWLKAKEL